MKYRPLYEALALATDWDGTVIDTREVSVHVVQDSFARLGQRKPSKDAIVRATQSHTLRGVIESLLPSDFPEKTRKAAEIVAWIKEEYPRYSSIYGRKIPGAIRCLKRWHSSGRRIAVVTNNSTAPVKESIESIGLSMSVDVVVSGEDVAKPKPDPESVLTAAHRLGVKPRQLLMIGDTSADIEAGNQAGSITAAVLSGVGTLPELLRAEPDYIVPTIAWLDCIVAGGHLALESAERERSTNVISSGCHHFPM